MLYRESAEVDKSAYDQFVEVANALRHPIEVALMKGCLADVDLEFCYIPIVMGPDFAEFYPARSTLSMEEKRAYHSPCLDYTTFVSSVWTAKLNAYLEGILSAEDLLKRAGFRANELAQFRKMISSLKS